MTTRKKRGQTIRRLGSAAIGAGLAAVTVNTVVRHKASPDEPQGRPAKERSEAKSHATKTLKPRFGAQRTRQTKADAILPTKAEPQIRHQSAKKASGGEVRRPSSVPVAARKSALQGKVAPLPMVHAMPDGSADRFAVDASEEMETSGLTILAPPVPRAGEPEPSGFTTRTGTGAKPAVLTDLVEEQSVVISDDQRDADLQTGSSASIPESPDHLPEQSLAPEVLQPSNNEQTDSSLGTGSLHEQRRETIAQQGAGATSQPPGPVASGEPLATPGMQQKITAATAAPEHVHLSRQLPKPQFGPSPDLSEVSPSAAALASQSGEQPPISDMRALQAPAPVSTTENRAEANKTRLPKPLFGDAGEGVVAAATASKGLAEWTDLVGAKKFTAASTQIAPPLFTPDDELILEITSSGGDIGDTIIGYGTRSGVFLPLGAIARLLDLAIVTSDDGRYASGWVLDEKNTIELNLREGSLRINGGERALAPDDAVSFEGEIYLRAERFGDVMPLTMSVNLRTQTATFKTLAAFPFEQKASREAARKRLGGIGRKQVAAYVRKDMPWRAATFPLGDVEVRAMSDRAYGLRSEADLRLSSDLAFLTARAFASANTRDGLVSARLELGRRDPDAGLLGPLHATQFKVGDVATTALPLGLRGVAGIGVQVSNAPLGQTSVFDRVDLRGDLPDGYEAELYRNNALIASTREVVNGQYLFLQIPVEFGLNIFRIVLYGPQGQRREDVRRLSVGDGRLGQGILQYDLGLVRKEASLIDAHGPNFSPGQDFNAWRLTGALNYGISTNVTSSLGGGLFESGGAKHWLVTTGLRTGISGVAIRIDAGLRDRGGKAAGLQVGARTAGVNWTASHFEYAGPFADEVRGFTIEPLRRATELDINAVVRLDDIVLPMTGRMRRLVFSDGRIETDAGLRGSMMVGAMLASNSLFLRQSSTVSGGRNTAIGGTFDLATVGRSATQFRVALDYAARPQAELTALRIAADRYFGPVTSLSVAAGHVLSGGSTTLGLTLARRFERFSLGLDGTLNFSDNTYSAGLRLAFSFGRNPIDRSVFFTRSGTTSNGAAALRVFEDANGNGRFDAGEPPLNGVSLAAGGRSTMTNEAGIAFMDGLADGQRVTIRLDETTLPDVDMAPLQSGVEIVPRVGRVQVGSFGVVGLSEITGVALLGELRKELSGLWVELIDNDGKVAARTRTSAGGAFYFERVMPGTYHINIDKIQSQKLGISALKTLPIVVGHTPSSFTFNLIATKK